MECSDLESVGTYEQNNEWGSNINLNEGEQFSTTDDAEMLQRESFAVPNFAPEVAHLADVQSDVDEKLRLNQIRLQQLEEIDRSETARLADLQQTIENIRRGLELMPEEEKLETDRYKEALLTLQDVRTKEVQLNDQIEYIVELYDDNTDVLRGIETSFAEQRRLNCQRYAAFDAILEDLRSMGENVFFYIGDNGERIKRANARAQRFLAKLTNRRTRIEELSKKIDAGCLSKNRLEQALAETNKSADGVAAQLVQLETRISEEKQLYLTNEHELNKAEEEVDGHLDQIEKDLGETRVEFQDLTAHTDSRRLVLNEKTTKLEVLIEEKSRLEKEKDSKRLELEQVKVRLSTLLETRLQEETIKATENLDRLSARLLSTETEVLQAGHDFDTMQNDYETMTRRLELSTRELEMLQENVIKASSELSNKRLSMTAEYEGVRAKKEALQSEGRSLCLEVNEIRAKKAELEALKEIRMAQLAKKKSLLIEAEKKKSSILEGKAEIGRLANEQKDLLEHSRRVQELLKSLEVAKQEAKTFEESARDLKEKYDKDFAEIAELVERANIEYNQDALIKKQADIVNISQKKITTEEKLTSVKKLVKKAADRNQHLSLEARLFGAASDGLFRTIAPLGDVVTSTVQNVSSTEQRPGSANVSSTVDSLDIESSPHSVSSEVAEFEKNRLQIRRSMPARRRL